ncbi:ABC transporter permease [Gordonia otitidis]|uniref:ABC transporter permease n=1 Tax=Gordonia otitidis TaxID=249058 RepID=UPI001D13444B|nr:ABC transporter permease [Gordonia otitidis]UEA61330.1 ABC transporter permease [Gordonia otitidis]
MGAVRAEQIKLTSTRAPWWCTATVVVLGLGIAALIAVVTRGVGAGPDQPSDVGADASSVDQTGAASVYLIGVNFFGVVILMIMAVLGVTTEFRYGTIRTSFLGIPRRWNVLCAKALVYVALTFVIVLPLTLCSVLVVIALSDGSSGLDLGSEHVIRQIWGTAVWASLCVVVGIGVGAIVRQTAGAVSVVLVWMLVIENVAAALPVVGRRIGPFLPFRNGSRFLDGDFPGDGYHWNSWVSLVYFAVFAAIVFAIGLLVVNGRDAG